MKILELAIQILEAFNVYMAPEPGEDTGVGQMKYTIRSMQDVSIFDVLDPHRPEVLKVEVPKADKYFSRFED